MTVCTAALLYRACPLAALLLAAGAVPSPAPASPAAREGTLIEAHLDIKPGSCPNPVNVNHPAGDVECIDGMFLSVIPVSVLGNKFDVDTVQLGSVSMSRVGFDDGIVVLPIQMEFSDTGTPFEGTGCDCHDLTGDGLLDLDIKFDKRAVVEAFGLRKEEDGAFVTLQITGLTKGEQEFRARDCIRIINN